MIRRRANRDAFAALQTLVGLRVPRPFLLAILLQESDGQHFRTPTEANADDFIVVGLDRNDQGHPTASPRAGTASGSTRCSTTRRGPTRSRASCSIPSATSSGRSAS